MTSSNLELSINKLGQRVKLSNIGIGLLCLVSGVYSALASAEPVTVKIVDRVGNPLADAVVRVADEVVIEGQRLVAGNAIVDQVDRQFTPFMTVIRKGSTITFPNSDNIRHHVYSFSKPKPFELKLYANEERPSLEFMQPGLVTLGCNIHDQMIAHIIITDQQSAWLSGASGELILPLNTAAEGVEISIWHPWLGVDLNNSVIRTLSKEGQQTIVLDVTPPQQQQQPKSRLEQRFNRTGTP